ncbi:hypothetical protein T02_1128 [Trichinella nativa]|uniref:Uncharacterized protein n=1 Tax=Trichinella nativa TaxID=6335 RepID=A0A0V1LEC6_9BILA|nr:hypothetical protein T02_1128 [Trichinella nativa]
MQRDNSFTFFALENENKMHYLSKEKMLNTNVSCFQPSKFAFHLNYGILFKIIFVLIFLFYLELVRVFMFFKL